jgi:hypothetical protein
MRFFLSMAGVVVALALQGCAGTGSVIAQSGPQALQLFNADSSPRFTFYLACTSEDASCSTVENAFSDWASDRHVTLRLAEPGDTLFTSGIPSFGKSTDLPYRVAVRFAPLVVPSFTQFNGGGQAQGGYTPPKVGYTATIYVFDSAAGKLLQKAPSHEQRTTEPHGHANGYIRSEVNGFIASLDPAYRQK